MTRGNRAIGNIVGRGWENSRKRSPLSPGFLVLLLCATATLDARRDPPGCGTTAQTAQETLFLHRQARRSRARAATRIASTNRDIGNIAIIEDSNGVVEKLNQFNLDNSTLTFTPASPTTYNYAVAFGGYDTTAASQGNPVVALGDDDARAIALPFAFPFYGNAYGQVYLNSDGNLTFNAPDFASSGRSVGRMTGGPPRISPLFDDLDPSVTGGGVRVFTSAGRIVFTWQRVAEYAQTGAGPSQTFQARLYSDGRIEFSYGGANPSSAVVGIAPGAERGGTTLVSFHNDPGAERGGAIVERFGNTQDIDVVSVAQKFYETHEDAYDYLVVYNALDIGALPGALAYESTVRSSGTGYGVPVSDTGAEYGSASRLLSAMNMGPITNYPADPNATVPLRGPALDTPLTVLGHEAGHLFLAFASVSDPDAPGTQPMIGYGGAHWSFVFNSEASLDEGEQITDRGAGTSPRFLTSAVTQGYSPLDRYLMGFGPAGDVPPTFYVKNFPGSISAIAHPAKGIAFDGLPVAVTATDVAAAMGRRTPDSTVAQHHYRFGFILVVAAGSQDALLTDAVQKVEQYRAQFPAAYAKFSAGTAIAETTLNKSVRLSLFPAAGVVAGGAATATLTLQAPPKTDLTFRPATSNGFALAPAVVTVPAGATTARFALTGLRAGVEELTLTPSDASYETAFARVQVAGAGVLTLHVVSGAPPDPIVVSLTDANGLAYPDAGITASASGDGSVTPAVARTDATGLASFQWTPGSAALSRLTLAVQSVPAATVQISAGASAPSIGAVVNAASNVAGMAPGSIDTIYGANLLDSKIALNGSPIAQIFYGDSSQINFYVPTSTALGAGTLSVTNASGVTASSAVNVTATDPGIFAIVHAGTATPVDASAPAKAGEFLEIYCTGLGTTRAVNGLNLTTTPPVIYFGATQTAPAFSGIAPGFTGLYQVDVQVPAGLTPGAVPVVIGSGKASSNQVAITVQ